MSVTPRSRRRLGAANLPAPQLRAVAPRVVVTGGAGFLGCNLVDRLCAEGRSVLVVDNLARDRVAENLEWLTTRHQRSLAAEIADIRDPAVMREAACGATAVIHLAAQVAVTTSVLDPVEDFEINARGTLNVLEAVRNVAPDAPVIFASTNKVYGELIPRSEMVRGETRYRPRDESLSRGFDEATPLSFHSPYGCSKGVADQYVIDYSRIYGLRSIVLRMSCLYGPRQFGTEDQGWVAHFLIAAMTGRPITIFGDGFQVRDVLYVDDAVSAYVAALNHLADTSGRAFNLGGGPQNAISLRDLLALITELAGREPELAIEPWRPGDQAWYVTDTSAFTRATGWRPRTGVNEGLRRLAAWVKTLSQEEPVRQELSA
jgi:CDP-paratose 2-epimerase